MSYRKPVTNFLAPGRYNGREENDIYDKYIIAVLHGDSIEVKGSFEELEKALDFGEKYKDQYYQRKRTGTVCCCYRTYSRLEDLGFTYCDKDIAMWPNPKRRVCKTLEQKRAHNKRYRRNRAERRKMERELATCS